ncbi:unnamed protein product [Polarella glacialis]|uniref:Protein-tyrosine sulfotransferase n=2 Tax=Polarella glacialis TaxID=89957 RepID=A0A813K7X8_POLGL|nr:unnamed protein product [Polarella glacialis]
MDVWSTAANDRAGRLQFSPREANSSAMHPGGLPVHQAMAAAYKDIAHLAGVDASRGSIILEKFPEHAFRIGLLEEISASGLGPGRCTFIHLWRNGVEVARSIARFGSSASWYGVKGERKWCQLAELMQRSELGLSAEFRAWLEEPTPLEARLFARGLVEWYLTVQAARDGLKALRATTKFIEVRYEELLESPGKILSDVEELMGLQTSAEARQYAQQVLRRSPPAAQAATSVEEEILATVRGSKLEAMLLEAGSQLPGEDDGKH